MKPLYARTIGKSAAVCALLASTILATPSRAQNQAQPQTAPTPDAPQATDQGALKDIIVTAERRSQSLQKVSISATVLNADDLRTKGVTAVTDIQQVAPSVAINTYNRSTFINIRGVGIAQSNPTSSNGVAYYIDGQYVPSELYIGFSFFDINSVEVLRGPQGTLTGQNSTGGALYVRTPTPQFDKLSGYAEQTFGQYHLFRSNLAVNLPISDTLAVRVAATRESRGSFSEQVGSSPSTPGNVDMYAFRTSIRFQPAPWADFNLHWTHFDNDTDNNAVENRTSLPVLGPFRISEDAISYQRNRGDWLSGEMALNLSRAMRWRTTASFQKAITIDQTDGDRTATAAPRPPAANIGRIANVTTTNHTFVAETNLLSTNPSPFQWVVGAFYLKGSVGLDQERDNNHTVNFVSSTATTLATADNRTEAVFGQINYKIVPQLELIAGARYSEDRQSFLRSGVTDYQSSKKVTGRVAANFYPTPSTMLYLSASRGYKAGGVNLGVGTPPYAPETNTVYETGVKTTLFDRHLRINADVFHSDYKGIQFNSLSAGAPLIQNAPGAKSNGAELEVTGQFDGLAFNGGVSYLDASFAQSVCLNNANNPAGDRVNCLAGSTATTANDFVARGSVLPFAPKWTINAGVQYQFVLGDGATITPRLQYSRLDSQLATPFAGSATVVPGRDLVDARLTVVPSPRFTLEAYATNLLNKTYIASQIQDTSTAAGGIIFGAPRQVGLRVSVKLGPL